MGRARARSSPTSRSSRRRRSSSTAATAASASTPARPARSTSRGRSTRTAASRTGRRRRRRSRRSTGSRSATWSTAATSARTSARGTAASRSAGADEPAARRADGLAGRVAAGATDRAGRALRPALRPAQRCAVPAPERARRARQRRAAPKMRRWPSRTRPATTTCSREHAEWALARIGGRERSHVSHEQRVHAERWLAWVRLGAVPFAIVQAVVAAPYTAARERGSGRPPASSRSARSCCFVLARQELDRTALERLGLAALVFDFVVVSSFILALYYEPTTPIRQVMILVLVEAAFRYGIRGGLVLAAASVPVLFGFEWLRDDHFDQRFRWENVAVQVGDRGDDRPDRRLARAAAAGGGDDRPRPGEGGRAAAGRARPAQPRARRGEPLRAGARLVARARRGLRRVHPRAAQRSSRSTGRRSSCSRRARSG